MQKLNHLLNEFELKIPLNSFSSFCDTQIYGGKGETRINVQLKTDQIDAPVEVNPYQNLLQFECAFIRFTQ